MSGIQSYKKSMKTKTIHTYETKAIKTRLTGDSVVRTVSEFKITMINAEIIIFIEKIDKR